jgi:hypothetical protein
MSARAPAGSVNKKKGSEATVDNSEIINGDGVSIFIIHVAAVSWAATQIPETKAAIHSLRKIGFSKAAQVEVLVIVCEVKRGGCRFRSGKTTNGICQQMNELLPEFLF